MQARTIVKALLLFLLFGAVASYGAFRFLDYKEGSSISIVSPLNGSTVNSPLVNIKGSADRISYISLNDQTITTDKAGNFSQELLLHPGYNILSVKVTDRFGRESSKNLTLVYHPDSNDKNGFALNETDETNPS